jgi:hypothetical protein
MDVVETIGMTASVGTLANVGNSTTSGRPTHSRNATTVTPRMQAAAGTSVIARTPANPRKINRKMVLKIREKGLIA